LNERASVRAEAEMRSVQDDAPASLFFLYSEGLETTDLEALNEGLVGVVRETMQPAYVSFYGCAPTRPLRARADGLAALIQRST
jgi:hypothetical protein